MAENPTAGMSQEEEEDNIDYDSDGNPIVSATKKIIMPLPPIDHTEVHFLKRCSAVAAICTVCDTITFLLFTD